MEIDERWKTWVNSKYTADVVSIVTEKRREQLLHNLWKDLYEKSLYHVDRFISSKSWRKYMKTWCFISAKSLNHEIDLRFLLLLKIMNQQKEEKILWKLVICRSKNQFSCDANVNETELIW